MKDVITAVNFMDVKRFIYATPFVLMFFYFANIFNLQNLSKLHYEDIENSDGRTFEKTSASMKD